MKWNAKWWNILRWCMGSEIPLHPCISYATKVILSFKNWREKFVTYHYRAWQLRFPANSTYWSEKSTAFELEYKRQCRRRSTSIPIWNLKPCTCKQFFCQDQVLWRRKEQVSYTLKPSKRNKLSELSISNNSPTWKWSRTDSFTRLSLSTDMTMMETDKDGWRES